MFQSFEINRLTNTAPGADLLTLVKSNFWAQSGRNMSNFGGKSRWGVERATLFASSKSPAVHYSFVSVVTSLLISSEPTSKSTSQPN